MDQKFLDFEQPIAELEAKIDELKFVGDDSELNISEEIARLRGKSDALTQSIFSKLSAWQIAQLARHPHRPYALDYIRLCFSDFQQLHGDRMYADDHSLIGGIGRLEGQPVMIIGHQKGRDTKERVKRNYGMARPEGYRKALRLMRTAEKFHLPLITLIDTPGAYPGVDAEARGQAEAIARSVETCIGLKVPLISVIIGEGGSGGAMALTAANTVLMLEHAIYSVISPEGCASILWRDGDKAIEAAEALKLTADDLLKLGVIDRIIAEPLGGAHRNKQAAIAAVGGAIEDALGDLAGIDGGVLKARRREKYLEMGSKGLS